VGEQHQYQQNGDYSNMSFIELYNNDILDTISVGKAITNFDESNGDYIKVEIFMENTDSAINTFYSNRLLFKYPDTDDYYFGDYHYHPENPTMGFCTKRIHTDDEITNLQPIPIGDNVNEPLNSEIKYQKHFDIFRDNNNEIYIKPNEILKMAKLKKAKYKIRIHFLRNIKSTLGKFLHMNKNNLIENGNFFAGLEATQTGDLDRSFGRNNFVMIQNPGYGKFVLEQDGIDNNVYDMRVTGIKPSTYYVFSCWAAWDANFVGSHSIVNFDGASADNTSSLEIDDDSVFSHTNVGGLLWNRRYITVYTQTNANLGSIRIKVGTSVGSSNPNGRRYFTDLRFEEVENFDGALFEYIEKLKLEIN
jgi:hypothetical protein